VIVAAAQYILPAVNEVPEHFAAVVLWRFRTASLGIQIVLWATLGIGFGIAAEASCAQTSQAFGLEPWRGFGRG
jgi:hypothetical protein